MSIYNISASYDFSDVLAKHILKDSDIHNSIIFLPTKRAIRTMQEAFLRLSDGKPLLLPRLIALGDPDDTSILIDQLTDHDDSLLTLKPAISNKLRLLHFTQFVRRLYENLKRPAPTMTVLKQSQELSTFLDTAQRFEVDLSKLEKLVPEEYSKHWNENLAFLKIISHSWQDFLKDMDLLDPVDRWVRIINSICRYWQEHPPKQKIYIAGYSGSVPAMARLLKTISENENGCVILPDLDTNPYLQAEYDMGNLRETHPQYSLYKLCDQMGILPRSIEELPGDHIQNNKILPIIVRSAFAPNGVSYAEEYEKLAHTKATTIHTATLNSEQEEALYIAGVMRKIAEKDSTTCTLVTPNRKQAQRVKAELKRWDIQVDDSAGSQLIHTAKGVLVNSILEVFFKDFNAVNVLSMLKHNLCWHAWADKQKSVDILDIALRGVGAKKSLHELKNKALQTIGKDQENNSNYKHNFQHLGSKEEILKHMDKLFSHMEQAFAPMFAISTANEEHFNTTLDFNISEKLTAIVQTIENIANSEPYDNDNHDNKTNPDKKDGHKNMWIDDDGVTCANMFTDLLKLAEENKDYELFKGQNISQTISFFMSNTQVRASFSNHPRLHILGMLESRFHRADVVIIGDMNDGSLPPTPTPSPWLNKAMSRAINMPVDDTKVGDSAHDFAFSMGADSIYLTRSEKVDNAKSLLSPWWLKIKNYIDNQNKLHKDKNKAMDITFATDDFNITHIDKAEKLIPTVPPQPLVPVKYRPQHLSVTGIEALVQNPYYIYARNILKLQKLADFNEQGSYAGYGSWIHKIFETFSYNPTASTSENVARLDRLAQKYIHDYTNDDMEKIIWNHRFSRTKYGMHAQIRDNSHDFIHSYNEKYGIYNITLDNKSTFTLTGIVDRLDVIEVEYDNNNKSEEKIRIIDYKTGKAPTRPKVLSGFYPQLPLLALIAQEGGYRSHNDNTLDIQNMQAHSMWYWQVESSNIKPTFVPAKPTAKEDKTHDELISELILNTKYSLKKLLNDFTKEETVYNAHPHGIGESKRTDYDHLARVEQWSKEL